MHGPIFLIKSFHMNEKHYNEKLSKNVQFVRYCMASGLEIFCWPLTALYLTNPHPLHLDRPNGSLNLEFRPTDYHADFDNIVFATGHSRKTVIVRGAKGFFLPLRLRYFWFAGY